MRRHLSIISLCLAWLCANGALWNVVQVVGWAKMLHDYSAVMPAEQAMKITFDGSAWKPEDFLPRLAVPR